MFGLGEACPEGGGTDEIDCPDEASTLSAASALTFPSPRVRNHPPSKRAAKFGYSLVQAELNQAAAASVYL